MFFQTITLNDYHDFVIYLGISYFSVAISILLDSFANLFCCNHFFLPFIINLFKDELKFFVCLVGITLVDSVISLWFALPRFTLLFSAFVTITRWVHLIRIVLPEETSANILRLLSSLITKDNLINFIKSNFKKNEIK